MTGTTQRSTVAGVFHDIDQARRAIDPLKAAGFGGNTISVLSPDRQAGRDVAERTGTQAGAGAATGAVAGGILGGLGGWPVGRPASSTSGIPPRTSTPIVRISPRTSGANRTAASSNTWRARRCNERTHARQAG